MPVTPFHFGPGAAVHAVAPKHVSFLAFCTANVVVDVEPLYFMLTHQYPLHRFLHTFVGAAVGALLTVALFAFARWFSRRFWLPNLFKWKELGLLPVALGALAGTISHVLLDGVMHRDIRPFAPFSADNPLLGVVSLGVLHLVCVGSGIVAIGVIGVRRLTKHSDAA